MAQQVTNVVPADKNLTLISSREAARLVGYSTDYVSRLAREGKVTATQVGRQWLVDKDSLKLFSLHAAAERRGRQEQLRLQRLADLHQVKVSAEAAIFTEKKLVPIAFLEAAAIAACLFVFANLLFVSKVEALDMKAFVFGAGEVTSMLSSMLGWEEDARTTSFVENEDSAGVVSEPVQGVVLFSDEVSEETVAAVRDSFSDEVEVVFEGEDTGIVTPVFREKRGEQYQFLLVPVQTNP